MAPPVSVLEPPGATSEQQETKMTSSMDTERTAIPPPVPVDAPPEAAPVGHAPPPQPPRRSLHRKKTSGSMAGSGSGSGSGRPLIASSRVNQLLNSGPPPSAASASRRKHFYEEELVYPDRDHALAHGYANAAAALPPSVGMGMRKGASQPALIDALDGEETPLPTPVRRKSRPSFSMADRDRSSTAYAHGSTSPEEAISRKPVRKSSQSAADYRPGSDDLARSFTLASIRTPSGSISPWTTTLSRGKSLGEKTLSSSPPGPGSPRLSMRPRKISTPEKPEDEEMAAAGPSSAGPSEYPSGAVPLAHASASATAASLPRQRQSSTRATAPSSNKTHFRRASHDEKFVSRPRSFYVDVEDTQQRLLKQEDLDGDFQITVTDKGPKVFPLRTAASGGYKKHEVRGTYMLSNLLQELALASDHGRKYIVIAEDRLAENPVERLHRMIKYYFWDELTRRIDADGLEIITDDPKNRSANQHRRIYVPHRDIFAQQYYAKIAKERPRLQLEVLVLPEMITPRFVKSLDERPGILSLALKTQIDGKTGQVVTRGVPFVVPGGRFNEMYGWDSYFETLGLLVDGRVELGKSMVDNFVYMIEHYNKILNANRSYYLTRSQPPFLTDMILQVRAKLSEKPAYTRPELQRWTARCFRACIKELLSVWLSDPRLNRETGLSCYHTEGIGMPPETESSHFNHILEPYAAKHGVDVETFKDLYTNEQVLEPELDTYFVHDRAVRESGHDTTYRFEKKCADLATIDLNSLLYKYALDIASVVRGEFKDCFKFRVRRGEGDRNYENFVRFKQHLVSCGSVEKALGDGAEWDSSWAQGINVLDDLLDQAVLEIENYKLEREKQTEERRKEGSGEATNGVSESSSSNEEEATKFPADLAFDVSTAPLAWDASIDHPDSPYFTVTTNSTLFLQIARRIRQQVNKYCWNPQEGIFFDYNVKDRQIEVYETVTTLWALWAGLATPEQAGRIVSESRRRFEVVGGLVSGTEESRGRVGLDRPNRQWDYPYGWAPHQMMAWEGCSKYGMQDVAERFAYRWLYTITKSFVDFNGVVPEKFDVVNLSHKLDVEYGNVGTDFKFIPREGFGWMNSSFVVGLQYLAPAWKRALAIVTPPDTLFYRSEKRLKERAMREVAERERQEVEKERLIMETAGRGAQHKGEQREEEE